MARPFSIPAIPALAVGESYVVRSGDTRAKVARKVAAYAKRCKPEKLFLVVAESPSLAGLVSAVRVTRLPDPEPRAE